MKAPQIKDKYNRFKSKTHPQTMNTKGGKPPMNQKDTDYLNQISKNIDTICISIIDELNSQDIKQTWQVENLTITPDQVADQLKSKGGWRKYLKLQIQKNTQATAPVEQIVERFIVNQIALQINDTMIHYIDPDEVPI